MASLRRGAYRPEGPDQLTEALRTLAPALVVLEATGGFEVAVAAAGNGSR